MARKTLIYILLALGVLAVLLGPQAAVTGYHSLSNSKTNTNIHKIPTDMQPLSESINPSIPKDIKSDTNS